MGRKKGKKSKPLPPPPADDYADYEDFVPSCVLESSEEEDRESIKRKQEEEEKLAEAKREEVRERKRQQKREKKEKKEQEEQKRLQEIKTARKNAPNPRLEELKKICKHLAPLGLAIHEIAADGNCLYSAIAHQSSLREQNITQKEVRSIAAEFMRKNASDFLPFIDCDGDPEDNFESYCDTVENSSEWGGELELRALAHAMQTPITVYSSTSPHKIGEEFTGESFLLSYHRTYYSLGAHYNSVVHI